MARKAGSGLATAQANACAELFVALACERDDDVEGAVEQIDREYADDRCGMTGTEVKDVLEELLGEWPEASAGFVGGSPLIDGLGDAHLQNSKSGNLYIEVKSQTKKVGFRDITQADWVRDDTDFVRHNALNHAFFASHREAKHAVVTDLALGWTPSPLGVGMLWAADVGLLHDSAKRQHAGAKDSAGLRAFLERKWLLHVTQSGGRLIRLADIPAVRSALLGKALDYRIEANPQDGSSDRRGLAKIAVLDREGDPVFTYHLYETKATKNTAWPAQSARAPLRQRPLHHCLPLTPMTPQDSSLDSCVLRALRIVTERAPDRGREAAVEARRIVFGLVVIAAARSRGRFGTQATLTEGLSGYRLPVPAGALVLAGAVLDQVYAAVEAVAGAATTEQIVFAYERSLKWTPATGDGGGVVLDQDAQHAAGAFFTPPAVAERLLDAGLDPVLAEAEAAGAAVVRGLRICDPASGPGIFLLAALRRTSQVLARSASISPATAAAEVLRRCLYGVDLDAGAVELCRALCWLETELPWDDLSTLGNFRCGNSLLGATPALAKTMRRPQLSLFAPPQSAGGLEAEWCRKFADEGPEVFFHWHREFPEVFDQSRGPKNRRTEANGGFDAIIGNPPFLNQLEEESAHAKHVRELLRARFSEATTGYADSSVAFTLLGVELLREGGRCTLIAPLSILGARDAESARARWAESATLESMWIATEYVFEGAAVFVCAPTLRVGGNRRTSLLRRRDLAFASAKPVEVDMAELSRAPTWSLLVADILGIPSVRVPALRTVGDEAGVTADFRDQYYGLRGYLVEAATVMPEDAARFPPLITTGLVDLAVCLWGSQHTRFDGQRWAAPRVDLIRLEREGTIGPWARSRLVPKLILATQTRVLEVVVDESGEWLPSIPLISVVPTKDTDVWHLAAALSSPPLTAIAAGTYLGTALTIDAIKLSANQVRALPLPAPSAAWDDAAALFRRAQAEPDLRREYIASCGKLMCEAYGLDRASSAAVLAWWMPRAVDVKGSPTAPGDSPDADAEPSSQ